MREHLSDDVWMLWLWSPGHPGVILRLSLIPSFVPWMPAVLLVQFHCTAYFICLKCSSPRSPQACPSLLQVFTQIISAQSGLPWQLSHTSLFPSQSSLLLSSLYHYLIFYIVYLFPYFLVQFLNHIVSS